MLDDQEEMAIIDGVIGLANVFKKKVIAEGVETAEQGLLLMHLGCDEAQGYGIARPMPAEDVPHWRAQFKPDWTWLLWAKKHWDKQDLPLLLAQDEHIKLVQQVIEILEKADIFPSAEMLKDAHGCRFGIWYAGDGKRKYGHLREYVEIDQTHSRLHAIGAVILQRRNDGHLALARALCPEFFTLKTTLLAAFERLQNIAALDEA
jgi:hypothetical protein